jgi:hypothetical protein
METSLTGSQQVSAMLKFVDSAGNPAVVEGIPTWAIDMPAVIAVDVSADGLTGTVRALGPLGTANLTVRADADLGTGVTEIIGTGVVNVVAGQAVTVEIQFGTPEEQP